MTVTSMRYLQAASETEVTPDRDAAKPPRRLWYAAEPPFKGYEAAPSGGFQQSSIDTAIVIDNGAFSYAMYILCLKS